MVRAITTNVCLLREYASSVWSPQSAGLIKTVQSIKRRFTANLPGSKRLTYLEDLNCFIETVLKNADLRPALPLHTKFSSDIN